MKKLLCVLMLGMVFGQAQITTRIYDLPTITFTPIANAEYPIDISAITGYDLENFKIGFYSVNDFSIYTDQSVSLTAYATVRTIQVDHGGNEQHYAGGEIYWGENMDSYSRETDPYIVDTDSHYIDVSGGHCGGTVDLSITVTAAFPDDNSGDTEYVMVGGLQRVIDVTIESGSSTNLGELFPEYDLEWAVINIVSCPVEDQCFMEYPNTSGNSVHNLHYQGDTHFYYGAYSSDFYAKDGKDFIIAFGGGTQTIKLLVTAEFPDDDTGDENGDGWDDVCYEAGAESGDVNLDGDLNVLDIVIYSNYILYP